MTFINFVKKLQLLLFRPKDPPRQGIIRQEAVGAGKRNWNYVKLIQSSDTALTRRNASLPMGTTSLGKITQLIQSTRPRNASLTSRTAFVTTAAGAISFILSRNAKMLKFLDPFNLDMSRFCSMQSQPPKFWPCWKTDNIFY